MGGGQNFGRFVQEGHNFVHLWQNSGYFDNILVISYEGVKILAIFIEGQILDIFVWGGQNGKNVYMKVSKNAIF